MTTAQAIILGIVQGLTEFLPVSSSGHLALGERLFEFGGKASVAFDVLVHLATLIAVLVVVMRDIVNVLKKDRRVIWLLFVASLPTGAAVFIVHDKMTVFKENLLFVGLCFLVTAGVLVLARILRKDKKEMKEMVWWEAVLVGVGQAFAILPGISRSGSTISVARMVGVRAASAFSFSFLLGAIAILGATVFEARDITSLGDQLGVGVMVWAFVSSFASGLIALLIFRKMVVAGKLHYFAWYLVPLAVVTIACHFK